MKRLLFLFILLFTLTAKVHALVQSDTHTFVLCRYQNCVLAIDRKDERETQIPVGNKPDEIILHKGKGYVKSSGLNNITVFDLKTLSVVHTVSSSSDITVFHLYKDYLFLGNGDRLDVYFISLVNDLPVFLRTIRIQYICSFIIDQDTCYIGTKYRKFHSVSLHDFDSITVVNLSQQPSDIVLHKDRAYITPLFGKVMEIVDLKTQKLTCTLTLGDQPRPMVVYGDKGYVACYGDNKICVINLLTYEINEIATGKGPWSMHQHGNRGYVVERYEDSILVLDLKTQKQIKRVFVDLTPQGIELNGDTAYVYSWVRKTIALLNLHTLEKGVNVDNPNNSSLQFSDKHLYLNGKKVLNLPLRGKGSFDSIIFFGSDYNGIVGDIGGNEDLAFQEMTIAIDDHNYPLAVLKFNEAMAYGSAKAYAIGAVAFKLGLWGAEKNFDRFMEFYPVADTDYYLELYNQYS